VAVEEAEPAEGPVEVRNSHPEMQVDQIRIRKQIPPIPATSTPAMSKGQSRPTATLQAGTVVAGTGVVKDTEAETQTAIRGTENNLMPLTFCFAEVRGYLLAKKIPPALSRRRATTNTMRPDA
jgi:hypothetical protein